LNNICAFSPVDHGVANNGSNLIQIPANLNATAAVRVLAWLDDPEAISKVGVLGKDRVAVRVVENVLKAHELFVHITFFYMERQWQIIKRILAQGFVIALHIVVNCLLVGQMEVVFLMVARNHMVRGYVLDLSLLIFAWLTVEATAF